MGRMTLSVPDEVLDRIRKAFPDLNLAQVARRTVLEKIEELEKMEMLKARGVL
jgi:hypothetical protein